MIPLLILSILLSWLIGFSLVVICFREAVLERFFLKLFLGLSSGLGISSSLYFFWSLIFDPSQKNYFLLEGIALLVLLFFAVRDQLNRNQPPLEFKPESSSKIILWIVLAIFAIIALWAAADTFYQITLSEPHGRYDAWAIWTYRARFIFRAGPYWLDSVSPLQFHPDYPLLLPLTISRAWLFAGGEFQKAVIVIAGLFTLGPIGLLGAALAATKKVSQGLLGVFLIAATSTFVFNGTIFSADIPQSFFILSAVVLTYLALNPVTRRPGIVLLAGLNVGYTGWVKNEGLMFLAICLGVTLLVVLLFLHNSRLKFFGSYLTGLALPLLTIAYFKTLLSPQNDLINPHNLTTFLEKFLDPARYQVIFKTTVSYLSAFGGWTYPLLLLLLIFFILSFGKMNADRRLGFLTISALVVFQFIGYEVIYLITPFDVYTHMRQSLMRLLIHIYPAFLFIFLQAIKSPEEIFLPLFSPSAVQEQQPR